MRIQDTKEDIFPSYAQILRSLGRDPSQCRPKAAPDRQQYTALDNTSITGIIGAERPYEPKKAYFDPFELLEPIPEPPADHSKAIAQARKQNKQFWTQRLEFTESIEEQVQSNHAGAKARQEGPDKWILQAQANKIEECGKYWVVQKIGGANYRPLYSYKCKNKVCPSCAAAKQNLKKAKYCAFFEENEEGKALLEGHDLGFLTITLRHGEGSRQGWYHEELHNHFRNSIKYGNFKKYIAGGCWQTEAHLTENGFHIHRHILVLIDKQHRMKERGSWQTVVEKGKEKEVWQWTDDTIEADLRRSWHKKTGDSFQIDLTPLKEAPLAHNICEIFKYVSKKKAVAPEVAIELGSRPKERLYGRFGNLYKIAALNLNDEAEDAAEGKEAQLEGDYYIAHTIKKTTAGHSFKYFKKIGPKAPPAEMLVAFVKQRLRKKKNMVKRWKPKIPILRNDP